ncbi:unnamed protein product [Calypogeia fissa]
MLDTASGQPCHFRSIGERIFGGAASPYHGVMMTILNSGLEIGKAIVAGAPSAMATLLRPIRGLFSLFQIGQPIFVGEMSTVLLLIIAGIVLKSWLKSIVLNIGVIIIAIVGYVNSWRNGTSSDKKNLPDGIGEVNESVWQLYAPAEGDPEVDIIFFHGLQLGDFTNAVWKTWLAKDRKDLSREDNCRRPVFLVGHSLGGIIIKQFILSAVRIRQDYRELPSKRIPNFLDDLKGVFYYSSPNQGSRLADLAHRCPQRTLFVKLLITLNTEMHSINSDFSRLRRKLGIPVFAMAEGRDTRKWGLTFRVVEEVSALHDCDHSYVHPTADHFTVCKAEDKDDPRVIGKLVQFIEGALLAHEEGRDDPQVD